MTFSATKTKSTVFGDLRVEIYDLTDVHTSTSTLTIHSMGTIYFATATNETDLDEQMGTSISGNVITITAATDADDGKLLVLGH